MIKKFHPIFIVLGQLEAKLQEFIDMLKTIEIPDSIQCFMHAASSVMNLATCPVDDIYLYPLHKLMAEAGNLLEDLTEEITKIIPEDFVVQLDIGHLLPPREVF